MESFLHSLVAFFAANNIVPPEVQTGDVDLEGTYLYELPAQPNNVYAFNLYEQALPRLGGQGFAVKYLQVIVRNKSMTQAQRDMERIFNFVVSLADPTKDFIQEIDGKFHIFEPGSGPVRLNRDEQKNFIWSLSFPVKTQV